MWKDQGIRGSFLWYEGRFVTRIPREYNILPVGQGTTLFRKAFPSFSTHYDSIQSRFFRLLGFLCRFTHEKATFSGKIIHRLGKFGLLSEGLEVLEVLLDVWPRETALKTNSSIF